MNFCPSFSSILLARSVHCVHSNTEPLVTRVYQFIITPHRVLGTSVWWHCPETPADTGVTSFAKQACVHVAYRCKLCYSLHYRNPLHLFDFTVLLKGNVRSVDTMTRAVTTPGIAPHPYLTPMKVCKRKISATHYCALPPSSTYRHAQHTVTLRGDQWRYIAV